MALLHRLTYKHAALALLAGYFVLVATYSVVTPPYEAPDEVAHFKYVVHLLRTHTLPVQRMGEMEEAHQPPLYYALAALAALPGDLNDPAGAYRFNPHFMWAGQGGSEINAGLHGTAETFPYQGTALAFHLARLASILMSLGTVALTVATGWELFPQRRVIGLLAGALAAFSPQFLFISGAVNNDNLLTLAATGTWWQLARTLRRPDDWRQWLWTGLWMAAGLLAKPSVVVTGIPALVLLIVVLRRRSPRLLLQGCAALGLPVVVLAGWWLVRNQIVYGDPLGWTMFEQVYAGLLNQGGSLDFSRFLVFITRQLQSFWGVFGWMNVPAPDWFFTAVRWLCLLGLAGLGAFVERRGWRDPTPAQRAGLLLLAGAIVAQEAYLTWSITRFNDLWFQGRYLFPVIAPIALLIALGLVTLVPPRWARWAAAGVALALAGTAGYMALGVIQPHYPMVPKAKLDLLFVPRRTDYSVGDAFELKGYAVREDPGGTRLRLTLYWRATRQPGQDFTAFVHLIDGAGRVVTQKDQVPGVDLAYTPLTWWPGDIVADEHVLDLPANLPAGTYRYRVGLYVSATGEQQPIASGGQLLGNFVILAEEWQH